MLADRAADEATRGEGGRLRIGGWLFKNKVKRRVERRQDNGRELYRNCPEVGYDKMDASFRAVQFMIGHGNIKSYLRRFPLQPVDGKCECGLGSEGMHHVTEICTTGNGKANNHGHNVKEGKNSGSK